MTHRMGSDVAHHWKLLFISDLEMCDQIPLPCPVVDQSVPFGNMIEKVFQQYVVFPTIVYNSQQRFQSKPQHKDKAASAEPDL